MLFEIYSNDCLSRASFVSSYLTCSIHSVCCEMKFLVFVVVVNLLVMSVLTAKKNPVFVEPLQEDELCPYHYCPSLKFVCAFDGKKHQYFRNRCYMLWHNYCFRGSELKILTSKVFKQFFFFLEFKETRNVRGCID